MTVALLRGAGPCCGHRLAAPAGGPRCPAEQEPVTAPCAVPQSPGTRRRCDKAALGPGVGALASRGLCRGCGCWSPLRSWISQSLGTAVVVPAPWSAASRGPVGTCCSGKRSLPRAALGSASRSPCFCPLCCPSPGSAAAKPEPCLTESQVPRCRRRGAVAVLSLLDGPGFVPHVGAAPASRGAAPRCGDRVERGRYQSPAPARGVWGRSVGQP